MQIQCNKTNFHLVLFNLTEIIHQKKAVFFHKKLMEYFCQSKQIEVHE